MRGYLIDLDDGDESSGSSTILTPSSQTFCTPRLSPTLSSRKRSFESFDSDEESPLDWGYNASGYIALSASKQSHSKDWRKYFVTDEFQASKNNGQSKENEREDSHVIPSFYPSTKQVSKNFSPLQPHRLQKRRTNIQSMQSNCNIIDPNYLAQGEWFLPTASSSEEMPSSSRSRTVSPERSMTGGSQEQPVQVEDDDGNDIFSVSFREEDRQKNYRTTVDDEDDIPELTILPGRSIISEADYVLDEDLEELLRRLQLDSRPQQASVTHVSTSRRPIEKCRTPDGKSRLFIGKVVEFQSDGKFMLVKSLAQDGNNSVWLKGNLFQRTRRMRGLMPKRANELVSLNDLTHENGEDAWYEVERPLSDVLKVRALFFTNQQYPAFSLLNHPDAFGSDAQGKWTKDNEDGPLFCRWKFSKLIVDGKILEESIQHQILDEPDHRCDIKAEELRKAWYESLPVKGGSRITTAFSNGKDGKTFELVNVKQYTFGDAFCGGGGASRGALQAGLFVQWGFDFEEKAFETYRLNFENGGTKCYHEAVDEFIRTSAYRAVHVDILHLSPPCQPFSPAHTVPSPEQDEMNQAALLGTMEVLRAVKPRVVIMEETEGLFTRHHEWFAMLVHIFNHVGYSIRWKVLHCKNYGVPQDRRRLCIIAAAPGERLPPFPKPTHGAPGSGLLPLVTVGQAIEHLRIGDSHHDIAGTRFRTDRIFMPFNPNTTLAKTLTCGGGVGNYHPSGLRPYTIREAACLQTLPMEHNFYVYGARKQIGNMVPPLMEKTILQEVVKSLAQTDRVA